MKPKQRLEITEREGKVVASFLGKDCLGTEAVAELDRQAAPLAGGAVVAVVLDFSRIEHLDSKALKVLLRLHRVLKRRGGGLTLCGLKGTLAEVFRITKLDHIFRVKDSLVEALADPPGRSGEALPTCPRCAWPGEGRCLLCGTTFCDEHGSLRSRLCGRHRWVAWAALAFLVAGLVLLRWLFRK